MAPFQTPPVTRLDAADRYHAARAHKARLVGGMFAVALAALRRAFAGTMRANPCPPPRLHPRSRAAR
jgi:hypothetical protein